MTLYLFKTPANNFQEYRLMMSTLWPTFVTNISVCLCRLTVHCDIFTQFKIVNAIFDCSQSTKYIHRFGEALNNMYLVSGLQIMYNWYIQYWIPCTFYWPANNFFHVWAIRDVFDVLFLHMASESWAYWKYFLFSLACNFVVLM